MTAELEKQTEKIARQICLSFGKDESLWEIALNAAYDMVVKRPDEAKRIAKAYDEMKLRKSKAKRKVK